MAEKRIVCFQSKSKKVKICSFFISNNYYIYLKRFFEICVTNDFFSIFWRTVCFQTFIDWYADTHLCARWVCSMLIRIDNVSLAARHKHVMIQIFYHLKSNCANCTNVWYRGSKKDFLQVTRIHWLVISNCYLLVCISWILRVRNGLIKKKILFKIVWFFFQ